MRYAVVISFFNLSFVLFSLFSVMMKKEKQRRWSVADLLDYDYFHYVDKSISTEDAAVRDREIFLKAGGSRKSVWAPGKMARIWISARSERHESTLPSKVFKTVNKFLAWGLAILGIVLGLGYGFGILKYTGRDAINLFSAFSWLVILPFIFTLAAFLLPFVSRVFTNRNANDDSGAIQQSVLYVRIKRGFFWLITNYLITSSQKRREIESFFNHISVRLQKYGSAPIWIFAVHWQLFVVMFQLGSLFAVILAGAFHDLAFAWQTTMGISAQALYNAVRIIATPWHGWMPGAVPTVANIEGSHVILKDGIANLNTTDLSIWWNFLTLSMFFYAVLPRLMLFCWYLIKQKFALSSVDFSDAESAALFRRMTSPRVDVATAEPDAPLYEDQPVSDDPTGHFHLNATFNALMPDDIAEITPDKLEEVISRKLHGKYGVTLEVELDEETDEPRINSLPSEESILLILEGWQPCTMEYIDYIRFLRKTVGEGRLIVVGLIGKSLPDATSVKLTVNEFGDWRHKISSMRDQALDIVELDI